MPAGGGMRLAPRAERGSSARARRSAFTPPPVRAFDCLLQTSCPTR